MDREVFQINENGYIVGKYLAKFDSEGNSLEELKDNTITIQPTHGLFRPKWNGRGWVEDMPQEEIDELYKRSIKEPSEIDLLKQEKEILAQSVYDLTTIVELILTGGITE